MNSKWNAPFVAACVTAASFLLPGEGRAITPHPTSGTWQDAAENIFLREEMSTVWITLTENPSADPNTFVDCNSNVFHPATVRWKNSRVDVTLENCGVRNRGNTSRCSSSRSWRIQFDAFVPGQELFGMDTANLNGETNDPTSSRSFFAWWVYNDMQIASSRSNAVALYINGQFYGIENNTEMVDGRFVKAWFRDGTGAGSLFKNRWPADLGWKGTNPASYYSNYQWEGTNEASDWANLVSFIDFLNNTDDTTFAAQVESRFDVDTFLRYQATDVMLGSWDDYWYGSNNYYLYLPVGSTRWRFLPFDLDNTLGVDFFGQDWATRPVDSGWAAGGFGTGNTLLVDRILAIPAYRDQYYRYIHELQTVWMNPARTYPLIDAHKAAIAPAIGDGLGNDPYDGYDGADALLAFDFPSSYGGGNRIGPAYWGLKPFMTARTSYVAANVPVPAALPPLVFNEVLAENTSVEAARDEAGDFEDFLEIYNTGTTAVDMGGMWLSDDPGQPLRWQIPAGTSLAGHSWLRVWCDNETTEGLLHSSFHLSPGGELLTLYTAGAHPVLVSSMQFPPLPVNRSWGCYPDGAGTLQRFYVVTPGAANDNSPEPTLPTPPPLSINEFMASNGATIADEAGDYDDWIEIYNPTASAVDMGGMFLSDTAASPYKAQIPPGVLVPAHGFLLFWADEEGAEGPRHVGFKLSAGGESIVLTGTEAQGFATIDRVDFGPQSVNISSGRLPDGGTVQVLATPSPGRSNVGDTGLRINEVAPDNRSLLTDEVGDTDPWLEIHNGSPFAISLDGKFLTNDPANARLWQFPPGIQVAAGGFQVIWCDAEPAEGQLHAPFRLDRAGGFLSLVDSDAAGNVVIDTVNQPPMPPDRSWGRYPDGIDATRRFYVATPGTANNGATEPAPGATPPIFINEYMALNLHTVHDEAGEYDDWFELYNGGDTDLLLGGMFLGDSPTDPWKYEIPVGVAIPAGGFLLLWADSQPAQGSLHASFSLKTTGESVLVTDRGSNHFGTIDRIDFGAQVADASEGRMPDGGAVQRLLEATPGRSNVTASISWITIADYSAAEGNTGTTPFLFTVSVDPPSTSVLVVNFSSGNGTAIAGSDYTATSGQLSIPVLAPTATITVPVLTDTVRETTETFQVFLGQVTGPAVVVRPTATGTILNDDTSDGTTTYLGAPVYVTGGLTVPPWQPGGGLLPGGGSTEDLRLYDDGATNGDPEAGDGHYTCRLSTTGMTPGDGFQFKLASPGWNPVDLPSWGGGSNLDGIVPATPTMTFHLQTLPLNDGLVPDVNSSSPVALGFAYVDSTRQIVDAASQVSAVGSFQAALGGTPGDPTTAGAVRLNPVGGGVYEGTLAGVAPGNYEFEVVLGNASTTDGTPYFAGMGYSSGNLNGPVPFVVANSATPIVFRLDANASRVGAFQGATRSVTITDAAAFEGNTGTTPVALTVTISPPPDSAASVAFATADDGAHAGSDYTATNGTLNFAVGQATATITVHVTGDTAFEPDEAFLVRLSSPSPGLVLARDQGVATIRNDDVDPNSYLGGYAFVAGAFTTPSWSPGTGAPTPGGDPQLLLLCDDGVAAGDAIAHDGLYSRRVTLSQAPGTQIGWKAGSPGWSPVSIPDLGSNNAAAWIAADGHVTFHLQTVVQGDGYHPDKGDPHLQAGFLYSDSVVPAVSVASSVKVVGGFQALLGGIAGDPTSTGAVAMASVGGGAWRGVVPGLPAGNSSFRVVLNNQPHGTSAPSFGMIGFTGGPVNTEVPFTVPGAGHAMIFKLDAVRQRVAAVVASEISIAGVDQNEGNLGASQFHFPLSIDPAVTNPAQVTWSVQGVTAVAGEDFDATGGTLNLAIGASSAEIVVLVHGNTTPQDSRTFTVTLSDPTGDTWITHATATGTIRDDDPHTPNGFLVR